MKSFPVFLQSSLLLAAASTGLFVSSNAEAITVNAQPDELVSSNGKLDVILDVKSTLSLDGTRLAPHYNSKPMGPTLRVKPGDALSVTLNNLLPPGSDLDRELYDYTHDPQNEIDNLVNMTIIYNRLDEVGNNGRPTYGKRSGVYDSSNLVVICPICSLHSNRAV